MRLKRIVSGGLAAMLLLSVPYASVGADTTEPAVTAADGCTLQVDAENGEMSVAVGDFLWRSSPVPGGFDESAEGEERTNQRSLLLIEYLDSSGNVVTTNSFVDAADDNLTVRETKSGTVCLFRFADQGITVPLIFQTEGNTLTATVDTSEIKETGENRLLTVSLLPFFGAGAVGEEGYLLIPDGSGALISFEKTQAHTKIYEKSVYGDNAVLYKNTDETNEKSVLLPVFGIRRGDHALLGIITRGDGVSSLVANAVSGYYGVGAKFTYRQNDQSHLMEGSSKEKVVENIPKQPTKADFSVRYQFWSGDTANYIGMAEQYRTYMMTENQWTGKAQGISTDLVFTATAQRAKSFLGIPYTGTEVLTTLADVAGIVETLEQTGMRNVHITLRGALSEGLYGKVQTKVKLRRSVGSRKEYTRLQERLAAIDGQVTLLTDFQRIYKTGNGVSAASGTARDVAGAISKQYAYYPENFGKDESRFWRLSNAAAIKTVTESLAKSVAGTDMALGLDGTAARLYGDYHLKYPNDRAAMLAETKSAFARLKKAAGSLYFSEANSYALPYASMLSAVPTRSSGYDLFTQDVPFYPAVMHGMADYAGEAVNLSGDSGYARLKCVEYGAAVRYDLICRGQDILHETSEKQLFAADAAVLMPQVTETDAQLRQFYAANAEATITAHCAVGEDVWRTEYSNGNASLVNYGDAAVAIDGVTVEPQSYQLIWNGGAQ